MLRRKRRKGREEIKIVDFLPAVDFFISWYLFPIVLMFLRLLSLHLHQQLDKSC